MDDYLRVPSMIFTLGVNAVMRGLMVAHTGGYAPQTAATDLMRTLASERTLGIPNALFVWAAVSVLMVVILQRTPLGRYIHAIGNNEAAAYLAGVDTRRGTVICFALCGLAAALAGVLLAGVLLAGYSTKADQAMGDANLLSSIAAVVIGGTNILGRRGRYLGTLVGVVLIVLLNSVLSIMEMPEAGRQVIYGLGIILMLLVYGRSERVTS
jgi:ribose transport system permease protein